jgi:hypothetical protein
VKGFRALAFLAIIGLLQGCASSSARTIRAGQILAFFDEYARDLREGRRREIADRYSRSGTFFLGNGRKELSSFDYIRRDYLTRWEAPTDFRWCDLSIVSRSSNSAVVAARFEWSNGTQVHRYSYLAVLVRENGELRLRLEDESPLPAQASPQACEDRSGRQ